MNYSANGKDPDLDNWSEDLVEALSEIAQAINTLQEPGEVLESVLEIALERLEAERGFILLRSDDAAEGYEIRSYRNFTEEQLDDLILSTSH